MQQPGKSNLSRSSNLCRNLIRNNLSKRRLCRVMVRRAYFLARYFALSGSRRSTLIARRMHDCKNR
jgi:hypothetical protein